MKCSLSIIIAFFISFHADARLLKKHGLCRHGTQTANCGTPPLSPVVNNSSDYFAVLNPAQNTIITCDASTASGSAVATLTGKTFCIFLSYTGIAQETESHIHGPAPIGSGAEVLFALSGKANKRDCFAFNTTHVQWLNDGLLYANIHSANFAGGCLEGEIRGQILPAISRKKGHKHL